MTPSHKIDPSVRVQHPMMLPAKTLFFMVLIVLAVEMLVLRMSSLSVSSLADILPAEMMDMPVNRFLLSSDPSDPPKKHYKHPSLAFTDDPLFQAEYDRIDSVTPEERCAAFGLEPTKANPDGTPPRPRRLFLGTLITDESWEIIKLHASEVYNVYHAIAWVESNATSINTPRKMRYRGNTEHEMLLRSGAVFGNQTRFMVDYYHSEAFPGLATGNREHEQAVPILKMWKDAGMTEDDVGIMADFDEIVARDFLRALQVCDFPQFRPGQSCQYPKLCLATMVWEGSPLCRRKRVWFHPDVITGQCLDGIGDPSERIYPLREFQRQYGRRTFDYGRSDPGRYPQAVKDSGRFPLWSGRDIRDVSGCHTLANYKDGGDGVTSLRGPAYHLHNWFQDFHTLRNKYLTYMHADPKAMQQPLSHTAEDLDTMVRCMMELGNTVNFTKKGLDYFYSEENKAFVELEGNQPIYFVLNKTYVNERHAHIKKLVAEDVAEFGLGYEPPVTAKQ